MSIFFEILVRIASYGPQTDQSNGENRLSHIIRGIFSLSPIDVISTVVTQFLSPAIGNDSNWALCWQTSTHGWAASTFHSRCDGKNHTITVIRKDPYVFGGYTDIPWCKWLFRRGRDNKRDGVRKINIKPLKKPIWSGLGYIWQIIKQVTNSRTNQEL